MEMILFNFVLLVCLSATTSDGDSAGIDLSQTVKKDSPLRAAGNDTSLDSKAVVINEKPQITAEQKQSLLTSTNSTSAEAVKLPVKDAADSNGAMHAKDSSFNEKKFNDLDVSYAISGFYFFLAISSAAMALIVFRVYRLRLSRAERKYGVQGDRTTQELTPLPVAIEDANSDEEDQTLFEINREHIRIL